MPTLADLKGQYEEITARRTQNFKVFADGDLTHVSGKIGFMHFRDDPADIEEPFKDIHADLVSDKFSGVPFLVGEMDTCGYPELTVTHRATKQRVVLALADGSSVKSDTAKVDARSKRHWNGGKFGFESLGEGGIKAWYIIPDKKSSHVVRFLLHADEKIEWKGEGHSEEDSAPRLFVAGQIHWTPFWAKDAKGTFLPIHSDYDERTGLMTLTVEPDPKGKTVYPITIDPTAITQEHVGASTDDAGEAPGAAPVTNSSSPYCNVGDTRNQHSGFRFLAVPVPAGATVNTSAISIRGRSSYVAMSVDVFGHAHDNSTTFSTTDGDVDGRTKTTHSTNWTATIVNLSFTASPDISAPVGDIVARSGWATGHALSLIFSGHVNDSRICQYSTYDTGTSGGALFDCTYTAAATATAKSQVVMM